MPTEKETLDRKLSDYLERQPDERRKVQEMFSRVLRELGEDRKVVTEFKQEVREEFKGVKARVSLLEDGRRARTQSTPPAGTPAAGAESLREFGIERSPTGSNLRVPPGAWDAIGERLGMQEERIRQLESERNEQEAQARGASEALAKAQAARDNALKWILGLVTIIGGVGTALVYVLTHFH